MNEELSLSELQLFLVQLFWGMELRASDLSGKRSTTPHPDNGQNAKPSVAVALLPQPDQLKQKTLQLRVPADLTCPSAQPGSARWTPASWRAHAPTGTPVPMLPRTSPAPHPKSAGERDRCQEDGAETPDPGMSALWLCL